jgi:hypothetical protein
MMHEGNGNETGSPPADRHHAGAEDSTATVVDAAHDARLDRIERRLDELATQIERRAGRRAGAAPAQGPAASGVLTERFGNGMEETNAVLRDWFDRRPFLFISAVFVAVLIVFQIID